MTGYTPCGAGKYPTHSEAPENSSRPMSSPSVRQGSGPRMALATNRFRIQRRHERNFSPPKHFDTTVGEQTSLDREMKNRKIALIAISASVVVFGVIAMIFRLSPPGIPQFDDALFSHLTTEGFEILEISEGDLAQISLILEATKRDSFPKKWLYLGFLELRENGTVVSTIEIFTNANGGGPLRISDEYYSGYDQEAFRNIVNRATPMNDSTPEQKSSRSNKSQLATPRKPSD
jgi:hypothetical protein